jgi:hypothetical protein
MQDGGGRGKASPFPAREAGSKMGLDDIQYNAATP